jgi:hypothetical protein
LKKIPSPHQQQMQQNNLGQQQMWFVGCVFCSNKLLQLEIFVSCTKDVDPHFLFDELKIALNHRDFTDKFLFLKKKKNSYC